MSRTVDNRVVEMEFNNDNFEKNVKTSLGTLDKLKQALKLDGQAKGLNEINSAANKVSFDGMNSGIETVRAKFSALQIVGITVLSEIAKAALNTGKQMASSLISPIVQGGFNRALNIEQAKFQLKGLGVAWEDISEDINYGVKDTAYGLDAAAKVASQLVASGVTLGTEMKTALRGVSGVAAMTNSEYSEMGEIFTTVAGQGKLMTMQLRQMEARGLNAAATIGKVLGKTEAEVRDMVTKGEIDFKTFASAMDEAFGEHAKDANETYTGSLSNVRAALARIGADVQAAKLTDLRDIFNALRPVIDATHTALGPLITDITKLMRLGTDKAVAALNSLVNVKKNKDGTTTTELVKPLQNAIDNITKTFGQLHRIITGIVRPIAKAFDDIFPENKAKTIERITSSILSFVSSIRITKNMAFNLRKTFDGVFSVFDLFGQAVTAVIRVLGDEGLGKGFSSIANGLLESSGGFGEFIAELAKTCKESDAFYNSLKKVVDIFKNVISGAASLVDVLFGIGGSIAKSKTLGDIFNSIGKTISKIVGAAKRATDVVRDFLEAKSAEKKDGFIGSLEKLRSGFATFGTLFSTVGAGIMTVINSIGKALSGLSGTFSFNDLFSGLKNGIKLGILIELYDILQAYSLNISTSPLINIAKAVAILAGSLILLSSVDADRMATALSALAGCLVMLAGAMVYLNKFSTKLDWKDTKHPITQFFNNLGKVAQTSVVGKTLGLIALASALLIMAAAVKKLSSLNPEQVFTGLIGVAGAIAILVVAMKAISKIDGGALNATKGLFAMSLSLVVLAEVVKMIGKMDPNRLVQGLIGVGTLLLEIAIFSKLMSTVNQSLTKSLAGILGVSAALVVLSVAVKQLGNMDSDKMSQGLWGIGAVMVEIAMFAGMLQMVNKQTLMAAAVSMTAISASMIIFGAAIKKIGNLEYDVLIKGITAIGLVLLELAAFSGEVSMVGNIVAISASLLVFSAAAVVLSKAMKTLGNMEFWQIAKGIGALAATLGILAGAGVVAEFAVVGLLALAGAFAVISVSSIALGAGLNLIAASFATLGASVAAGGTAIVAGIGAILQMLVMLIPNLASALAKGLIDFLITIASGISDLVPVVVSILTGLLDAVKQILPQLIETVLSLLDGLLASIAAHAGSIGESITVILLGIMDSLGSMMPRFTEAGLQMMISFVNGMADAIRDNTPQVLSAMGNLISALIESVFTMLEAITSKIPIIGDQMTASLEDAKSMVREALAPSEGESIGSDFVEGAATGISSAEESTNSAADSVVGGISEVFQNGSDNALGLGSSLIENFTTGINAGSPGVTEAAGSIASGLGSGLSVDLTGVGRSDASSFSSGISSGDASGAAKKLGSGAHTALSSFAKNFSTAGTTSGKNYTSGVSSMNGSASTAGGNLSKQAASGAGKNTGAFRTAGVNSGQGFVNGLGSMVGSAISAAGSLGSRALQALKNSLGIHSPSRKTYEAGEFSVIGFVNAVKDNIGSVTSTMKLMGNKALNSITRTLGMIDDTVNSDTESSFTITPVVDMNDVTQKVRDIKSAFGDGSFSLMDASQIDKVWGLANSIKMGELSNISLGEAFNSLDENMSQLFENFNSSNLEMLDTILTEMRLYFPYFAQGLTINGRKVSNSTYSYDQQNMSRDTNIKNTIMGVR